MKKGKLIILEGGEGSGKTIQISLLEEWFNQKRIPYITTREPGGTPEGERIRGVLLNREMDLPPLAEFFLYESDRSVQYLKTIKPNLEKGINILSDRSWPSTEAYQGAAGNVDINLVKQLNRVATFGIMPDLLMILDIDPRRGLNQEELPDRFAEKGLEYHLKVREGYLDIAKRYPKFSTIISYEHNNISGMQEKIRTHVEKILSSNTTF